MQSRTELFGMVSMRSRMASLGVWSRCAGLLAFSLASAASFAQSPPDSLRACATLNSDHARLKCYDDAMAALGVTHVVPPANAANSSTTGPAPSSASGAGVIADGAVTGAPASKSSSTHVPPSAPAAMKGATASVAPDDFGLDAAAVRKKRGEPEPAPADVQLVARVKSVGHRPTGELRIELDNGQIWAETEKRAGSSVSVGQTVTIRPGKFGSYFLSAHSGFALRVARIQ